MAFFLPFALGAAAAAAGYHLYKNQTCCCKDSECSCGCDTENGKCECGPECDCGCNSTSKVKKHVAKGADFALDKIKVGLVALGGSINEQTVEKIKDGLKTVESKISDLQVKLKEEEEKA